MPDVRPKEEYSVQGISASQGIAYGQIFLYIQTEIEVPVYHVNPEKRMEEIGRFEVALLATRQQIQQIQAQVEKNLGPDEARIFDAHLMVLEDQALIAETFREFELNGHNIET
jgi:phosphotransferase system enzyme I (PtsI)